MRIIGAHHNIKGEVYADAEGLLDESSSKPK
jgi:hypothetical protein